MKNATAINATRWELYQRLQALGLPFEAGTKGVRNTTVSKEGIRRLTGLMPPV